MEISFVVTALQLFIIVPGIFLASYLAFVSPSEIINTLIADDQNVRAKISKNILHIGIITVLSYVVYFSFGGILLLDSPSWFKIGERRSILIITLFHIFMSTILLFLLYYIYRNQRLKFLIKLPQQQAYEVEEYSEELDQDDDEITEREEPGEKAENKAKGEDSQ